MAPNATVVGNVTLGAASTVWFSAVVRGDVAPITVGKRVNIQDGAVIHGTYDKSETVLEDDVSIGHNAIVHGAHVQKGALIGMGAVVMDHVGGGSSRGGRCAARSCLRERSLARVNFGQGFRPNREAKSATN